MSETTTERETEVVQGTIEGVTQKKPDTWQVVIRPEGSQYTKNLWTKNGELVTALTAKLGQSDAFVCHASYWTNNSGQQVRSLWIAHEGAESAPQGNGAAAQPVTRPKAQSGSDAMTKEDWAAKDAAIHKMACVKVAAGALTHTLPSDPTDADLTRFLERVLFLVEPLHRVVLAERDDPAGSDIPF